MSSSSPMITSRCVCQTKVTQRSCWTTSAIRFYRWLTRTWSRWRLLSSSVAKTWSSRRRRWPKNCTSASSTFTRKDACLCCTLAWRRPSFQLCPALHRWACLKKRATWQRKAIRLFSFDAHPRVDLDCNSWPIVWLETAASVASTRTRFLARSMRWSCARKDPCPCLGFESLPLKIHHWTYTQVYLRP